MLIDPNISQQHAGLQHVVLWLQQDVTRPKVRVKPTSLKMSGVENFHSYKDTLVQNETSLCNFLHQNKLGCWESLVFDRNAAAFLMTK